MAENNLSRTINDFWDAEILESICQYIRIPNKSPMFDPDWQQHGYMEEAVQHVVDWIDKHPIPGLICNVHRLQGRAPTLMVEIPGTVPDTVLLYGHLDKQPEFTGWLDGLDPWRPVIRDDRLYGRGGADDGYAIYASISAISALVQEGIALPRIVIIIECSEESGSPDLPFYMDALERQVGKPSLVIALDSTCGNYEQLWLTTSLRGMIIGDLRVQVLEQGAHSGSAGGIVGSSFRILRQLLSRLEDESRGEILPSFLNEQIPSARREEAITAGRVLADDFANMFAFAGNGKPIKSDPAELVLNNTWHACLEVTGLDGIPPTRDGGNVLRPYTSARLALRLPPTTDATMAAEALKSLLLENPPDHASVTFDLNSPNACWHAPLTLGRLQDAVQRASLQHFGREAISMGCGGSIPFMEFLAVKFPDAQFVVTGVLGPHSNAHGPNEFLHIPTAKKNHCLCR